MRIFLFSQYFFFICILSTFCLMDFTLGYVHCLKDQKNLLLELKNEFVFDSSRSTKLVRWNQTEDCCTWNGVECDGAGHVISLQLDGEEISGGMKKSSSLFSLSYLEKLNLANNHLGGIQIPRRINNLAHLTHLDLSFAGFGGHLPLDLWNLPLLETLKLGGNRLSGQINKFFKLQLSNLKLLDLSHNQLEGTIPKSFFELEKLESLKLANNFFNGILELEKIQRLGHLSVLDLSFNNLSVEAISTSSSFSAFPRLEYLGLASCNLYILPEFIRNQSELTELDLSNNQITGEIPSWIWGIGDGSLNVLNLSHNLLSDLQKPYHIPPFISILDLHSNQLQGELPMLPYQVWYVDLSNNNFEKLIPPNIIDFVPNNIRFLSVANNSLSGVIPTSLCNASNLEILDLSLNNLSGSIPPCLVGNKIGLRVLSLRRNNISGVIPNKFPFTCSLHTLDLSSNSLGGNIPVSLANCKSLEVMNVRNNNIQDIFPCMLSPSLRVLVLRSNRFHGHVRCQKGWTDLQIIDISSNNFSGYLYSGNFLSWRRMTLANDLQLRYKDIIGVPVAGVDSYYQDKVSLSNEGREFVYFDNILLTLVDFSCNNFQGKVPKEIGQLKSLHVLNLSHNSLTGTIPKSIGNSTWLEVLDFSANLLVGEIPQELTELTFLSVLNLSYNKLVGPIPGTEMISQFSTFENLSYKGNSGLCGSPLSKTCKKMVGNGGKIKDVSSNQKSEIEWDYVLAALGFFVGLGSII